MTQEALKMALQVLEGCVNSYGMKYERPAFVKAITAIKEALAQPAQTPVAKYSDIVSDGGLDPRNKFNIPPQRTEQEPVAWHEIVLNQKQFLDKMEWLLAKTAAPPQPEQDSTCSITLRLQGKPYPRTCKKCGLGPCIAQPTAQPEQEPVAYDKTEMNCFVQDLYDKKMKEGKHGHYETMFHVVHQAIKRVPPQRTWVGLAAEDRLTAKYMQDAPDGIEAVIDYIEAKLKERNT